MNIVCPNCNAAVDSAAVTPDGRFVCTACGSNVRLEGGSTAAWDDSGASRRMGKFELLDIVGSGGFGTVYKARDAELDRIVAVKVPHPGRLTSAGDSDRFFREARSVASLRHPSIVSVLEVGRQDGVPFLVEDFVDGVTLSDFLSGDRPDPRTTADLVAKIADALQFAHAGGVVHRDVKPSNIMLERASAEAGYAPRLMDFGLAKREGIDATMTVEGQVIGTPAFMSPEQARGEAYQVDGRTDIYSLGVILYQMLTGQLPFKGNARMLLHHVLHDEPKPPRKLAADIPRDLETICLKAMAKEPQRRYQTAGEMAADLRRFLAGEPIRARRVGPVERFAKWVRRRPSHAALAGMALLVVVGAVGVGALLAKQAVDRRRRDNSGDRIAAGTELVTQFYLNAVKRRGVLEGVWPITPEQARRAGRSYKFYTRAGRVEKVEFVQGGETLVDHAGQGTVATNYIADPRVSKERRRECRYEYRYNDRGQVAEEVAFDQRGRIIWIFHYTSHGVEQSTGHYTDARGFPHARTGSGASYVEFKLTPEGFEKELRYLDRIGRPQMLPDGTWGLHKEFDARGLPTRQTYIGRDGQPAFHRTLQYATMEIRYDERGSRTEQSYFDPAGKPVSHLDGWGHHRLVFRNDEYGNQVEKNFFGADGKPTLQNEASSRWRITFDDRGREIAGRDLGPNDEPMVSVHGFHRWTHRLDEYGNVLEMRGYDADNKPTLGKRGFHRVVQEYDQFGMLTNWASFGTDGKPILSEHRLASMRRSFDEEGNEIEWACFGLDGKPTRDGNGVAHYRSRHDVHGNRTELACYGPDEQPTLHREGWHRLTDTFDDRGNLVDVRWFGTDGKPILINGGYARVRRVFDERGLMTEMATFGVADEPVLEHEYARINYVYDERGLERERTYCGIDGKPTISEWGYTIWRQQRNDRGWLVDETFLDAAGKPVPHKTTGVERRKIAYDDWGRVTEESFLDADGRPTLHKEGYARIVRRYDERGREAELHVLGLNGRLGQITEQGISGWTQKYEALGYPNDQAFFGPDRQPGVHKLGYARIRSVLDARGRALEVHYLGADGQPAIRQGGHAGFRAKYDSRGNRVEETHLGLDGTVLQQTRFEFDDRDRQIAVSNVGPDGRPSPNKMGTASLRQVRDDRGNITEESTYGKDGEPHSTPQGFFRQVSTYDAMNRRRQVALFNPNATPARHTDGWSRKTIDYDDRGRVAAESFFDAAGQPVMRKEGWSKVVHEYDQRGNESMSTYLDTAGKPVVINQGYARIRVLYDRRDIPTHVSWHDASDALVIPKGGFAARIERSYNRNGSMTSEAYFGPDNKPMLAARRVAKVTLRYDDLNQLVEIANFGTDGKPVRAASGWARVALKYDDAGQEVGRIHFGLDDKPLLVRVFISGVGPGSAAEKLGLKTGDELVVFDNRPITSVSSLPDHRTVPAELIVVREGKRIAVRIAPGRLGINLEERVFPGGQ